MPAEAVDHVPFVIHTPSPHLQSAINGITGYDELELVDRREGPTSDLHLIISLGPRIRITDPGPAVVRSSFVVGPSDASSLTEPLGGSKGVQIRIDPLAAARVFAVPLHELKNTCFALDDVLGGRAHELERRVREAADWGTRFAHIERYLTAQLAAGPQTPSEVVWAMRQLQLSHGQVAIGDLTSELGWSRKRLGTAFRRFVGMTPKRWARLLRYEQASKRLRAGARAIDVAIDCGYSDQAHLCREIRTFSGGTVSEL